MKAIYTAEVKRLLSHVALNDPDKDLRAYALMAISNIERRITAEHE